MYGLRANGNQHGIVLTKNEVVTNMLDLVGYKSSLNLSNISVTEPAAGNGVFVLEIIKRLYDSSKEFKFSFIDSLSNLIFFEIDEKKGSELEANINDLLNTLGIKVNQELIYKEDFLLSQKNETDIVIGNPPYVRHENIPAEQKEKYRKLFGTFKHRSDLYVPFFEKSLGQLSSNGQLCFVCSNRWLKNQYGKNLRNLIRLKYHLQTIIDIENTNPFQESVIAYPSIIKISCSTHNNQTDYFELDDLKLLPEIVNGTHLPHKTINTNLPDWFTNHPLNGKSDVFLDLIENQGFKIGIGVATGSDKVFIKKDFENKVEASLLLPILTSKDVRGDKFNWQGTYILNPFSDNGELINLNKFPKAKKYLFENNAILKKRHISKKNPINWYRTIDKIDPSLTGKPKIILPDISGNKYIFIDKGDYYPHHNLYYITGNSLEKLKVLAAILLTEFVRNQLLEISVKMNGGYPRWQSQNLRKLRIPIINSFPAHIVKEIILAYKTKNIENINRIISLEEIEKYHIKEGQLKMFEPNPAKAYSLSNHSNLKKKSIIKSKTACIQQCK